LKNSVNSEHKSYCILNIHPHRPPPFAGRRDSAGNHFIQSNVSGTGRCVIYCLHHPTVLLPLQAGETAREIGRTRIKAVCMPQIKKTAPFKKWNSFIKG
jgi:folate-dependent phosphoribosylglycinamide formyltransferase PurN